MGTLIPVRMCRCAHRGSHYWGTSSADTYALLWYRLNFGRQRSSSKRETTCFVVASGMRRCKAIGVVWHDFRRGDLHHRHRHRYSLQPPMTKAIHPWSKGRLLMPSQMTKANPKLPVVSTSSLRWSANAQKRGVSSTRISRRAT